VLASVQWEVKCVRRADIVVVAIEVFAAYTGALLLGGAVVHCIGIPIVAIFVDIAAGPDWFQGHLIYAQIRHRVTGINRAVELIVTFHIVHAAVGQLRWGREATLRVGTFVVGAGISIFAICVC